MNELNDKVMGIVATHLLVTIGLVAGYVLTIKGIDIFKIIAGWSIWCLFLVFVFIGKDGRNG